MHRRVLSAIVSVAMVAVSGILAAPAQAAPRPIVVWADATRAPILQARFANGYRNRAVTVVAKDSMTAIRDELKTVGPKQAPDVIWAENAWTGDLAAGSFIVPVSLTDAQRALFPANVLSGFRYASAYYGVPVQSENLALITNAQLVPKPVQTFAALSKRALALQAKGKTTVGLAVAQGAAGNAYFMQPLFSGLGGYVFGTDSFGNLDPAKIGVNNRKFRRNAPRIDEWNASGLVNSALDVQGAQDAFTSGKAPFWITGQWSTSVLMGLGFKYYVSPVPNIVTGIAPAPFLGVRGFMVTSYAERHGVLEDASAMVTRALSGAAIQGRIARTTGRTPANVNASMGRLAEAFKAAGTQGTPMPNISQEAKVWAPLGKAWATSTAGAGAVPARQAFATAEAEIAAAP